MKGRLGEVASITGAAIVGTLGAHALYRGVGHIFPGEYVPPIVELLVGGLMAFTLRHDFWQVCGGVIFAQGILDLLYAGKVIAVEL